MHLDTPIRLALSLRDALTQAVGHAKAARKLLQQVDSAALLEHAATREAFNTTAAALSAQLAQALEVAGAPHGGGDWTLERLAQTWPYEGEQLAGVLREVRALSAALVELDAFNQSLAERALGFVRAYVRRLSPPAKAYTRRGLAPAAGDTHTLSETA